MAKLAAIVLLSLVLGGGFDQRTKASSGEASPALSSFPVVAELSAEGRQDAVYYAREFNVSQDEAERRLGLQDSVGSLKALQIPGYTLGVWLEHEEGASHIVGWYSSAELNFEPVIAAAAAKGLLFELRTDAPHSEDGMVAIAELGVDLIKSRGWNVAGSGVLNRSASILVQVMGSDNSRNDDASLASLARELRDTFGVDFDLRVVESASDDATYGGRIITSASYPACTTGFTVANYIGATGVLTSAHCLARDTYWENYPYNSFATTFIDSAQDGYRDVQWHTVVGTEYNQVFADSGYRSITSTVDRTDQLWDYVCHQGYSSGYSCGSVTSITFRPEWSGACPAGCAYSWSFVEGNYLVCSGGDSGGPWLWENSAYGIHKGHVGDDCVYMAQDFIAIMGVYILTS